MLFVPPKQIHYSKETVMASSLWKYMWIAMGLSRITAILKSPVLANIICRVERIRSLKRVHMKCTKADVLISIAVLILLSANLNEIYKLVNLMIKQSQEKKEWWLLMPFFLCNVCGLMSHLLAPAMFCVLSHHLTRALHYTVPALNDPAWQDLSLSCEERKTSLIRVLTRKREYNESVSSDIHPSTSKTCSKMDFLGEAESLLLDVDETLCDLLEYIGFYLLFMLVAMVMALIVMLFIFVESIVQEESTRWQPLVISLVYGVVFLYLNTTADDFNDEVCLQIVQ
ncbi:hypothetical protein Hamer_G031872 [Homarus americanus]|uniref:Uncharacterized protein n=1 Tax=Homarus americanus TaxID=6706 RepID=A0A8J5TVN5_HOMAM|nr:hypothetical protein Hamer_G014149 [Homarus americanus]KAG7177977.1 hypothetical protein Hamer_G031872 [Homarus americanus]